METDDWVNMMLETESLEDLLERFNLTPLETFEHLVANGMVDEELLEELKR